MKMKTLRNNKGFTLMELVVGMVILGLIIALTAPLLMNQYQGWAAQAGAEQVAGQMHDMQGAATNYQIATQNKATDIAGNNTTLVGSGYLQTTPVPPSSVQPYTWDMSGDPVYLVKTTTDSKTLCSKLNELYAGATAGDPPPAAVNASLNLQCFGAASPYNIQMRMYQ